MKVAELRPLDAAQLDQRLTELHTEWRNLRFQEAVGNLTATARIREIRKTIARIHTIRTERVLDEAIRTGEAPRPKTTKRERSRYR
ncbi:MAG: 50S ribosomal protein L29 [Chloroflexota bacterium]|nr:50S ribosomal protein L29 [Chloroflexota bacterium]